MKKVNTSTKNMSRYAGKWVAILGNRIIAISETLKEIGPLVTRNVKDKTPDEKIAAAFKVPYKGEGPYIVWANNLNIQFSNTTTTDRDIFR